MFKMCVKQKETDVYLSQNLLFRNFLATVSFEACSLRQSLSLRLLIDVVACVLSKLLFVNNILDLPSWLISDMMFDDTVMQSCSLSNSSYSTVLTLEDSL